MKTKLNKKLKTRFKTTVVFESNEEALEKKCPIVVHQGGSRSSKTYNILIWLIYHAMTDWDREVIDIFRKSFPSLRASVMFDFFQILKDYNLYSEAYHNKTEHVYRIGTNIFRFGSLDQEQKVRGAGRSYLFLNEANEMTEDEFKQLNQRTGKMTIIDYNPSMEFHWIYDKVLTREDTLFFQTTYRDNPYLGLRIRKEIEAYKNNDENYWRIYGLGERGISETSIYTHWKVIKEPITKAEGQEIYGLDFGFNNPTSLVRVKYVPGIITADEMLYKNYLTSDMIIRELERLLKDKRITRESTIYADSARPEIIEDIRRAGFNIHPAMKEKGSVLRGINFIKKNKFLITNTSLNYVKEAKSYKWKVDKEGRVLDEPVDLNDHLMDATRYALCTISTPVEVGVLSDDDGLIFG